MMADMTRTVVTVDKGEGWRSAFFGLLLGFAILTSGVIAMGRCIGETRSQRDEARRQTLDALTTANDAMDVAIELFKTCETP